MTDDVRAGSVRAEAYRAAAAAVDRFLLRIGESSVDQLGQVGDAARTRFRVEMGRVVDLNLDMVRNAFGLYGHVLDPENLRSPGRSDVLDLGSVVAGSTAVAVLWLHNFDEETMSDLALVGSRLVNGSMTSLDRPGWAFTPPTVDVPGRAAVPVLVEVAIPDDTSAGTYLGSVSPGGQEGTAIETRLEVVTASPIPHESW
ncbi:MAG: hypothetical protein WAL25_09525 [Acidimicrobiia bacterium]